jgi:hypothetical protein
VRRGSRLAAYAASAFRQIVIMVVMMPQLSNATVSLFLQQTGTGQIQ